LWEKGSMWELALDGGRSGVAHYVPPPPL
jgi:hypothetical protein